MKLNGEDKRIAVSVVGRCIDMFSSYLTETENAEDSENKREMYINSKQSFDNLYKKIQEDEELEQLDIILYVSALNTNIASMVILRNNYDETIKLLDNIAADLIEKYLQNV